MDCLRNKGMLQSHDKVSTYWFLLTLFEFISLFIGVSFNLSIIWGIIWGVVCFFINIIIGRYYTKNWKQIGFFLLMAPCFVILNFMLGTQLFDVDAKIFYIAIVLAYSLFWFLMAWIGTEKQYQCAVSFIVAVCTTLIGGGTFLVFIDSYGNEKIGALSNDVLMKLAVICFSILFIADKWGKFAIDFKKNGKDTEEG